MSNRPSKLRSTATRRSNRARALQKLSFAVFAAGASLVVGQAAQAANGPDTWLGNTDTNWATAGNWTTGSTNKPPISGDSLVFGADGTAGGATTPVADTLTNTLTSSTFNIAGITFNAGAPAYTMTGNTFNLTAGITNNSTSLQTFSNTGGLTIGNNATTWTPGTGGISLTTGLIFNGTGVTTTVNGAGNTLTLGSLNLNESNNRIGQTFAGSGNITITGAVSSIQVSAGTSNGSFLVYAGTGTLTLAGTNSFGGTNQGFLTANSGTIVLSGSTNSGNPITTGGTGNFTETSTGNIQGAGGLSQGSTGTFTLAGANTYTGSTTVNTGTLSLDFSGATTPTTATNIIKSGNTVNLGGATLAIKGGGAGATNSQTFGTTTLTASTTGTITTNVNGGTALNLALGSITRNSQSAVDITFNTGTGTVTTTATGGTGGLLGDTTTNVAYATANGGTSFVAKGGATPFTLSALPTASYTNTYATGNNVDVLNGDTQTGVTVNTLRFNTATDALTLGGTNTLNSAAILVTPTGGGSSITGGTITSTTAAAEVVIHDYSSFNEGAVIANANAGATATKLTLDGTGTTTLSGANTYTGNTSIDAGTTKLGVSQNGTTSGALGTGVGTTTVATVATLDLTTSNLTVANLGGAGTITSSASAGTGGTLTDTGTTALANLLTGSMAFASVEANRNSADTQVNNNNSTYSGGTLVRGTNGTTTGTISASNFNPAGGQQNSTTINSVRIGAGSTATLGPLGTGTITLDNGQIHETAGATIANPITVTANGGFVHFDAGGGTVGGAISGPGYLGMSNGFGNATTFSGSMSGFTGTLGVDTNNVGSVNFNGSATGNAAMSVGFFGTSTTGGYVQWNGTGSPTIQIGEVFTGSGSTTTVGLRGSTTATTTTTYQIGDNTTNTPVFAGVIANGSGSATTSVTAVTKVGSNNQTFSGASTYTGATTVNGGTLSLAGTKTLSVTSGITVASGAMLSVVATNALNTPATATGTMNNPVAVTGQVPVTLNGGTLLRSGASVSLGSGTTVGVGALTLTTTTSTIDFGTTGVGTLNFASLSTLSAANKLTVVDFFTTQPSASGTDGTDDRLIFDQNESANLSYITIDGVMPTQVALGNGEFELVAAVPEPSTWVAGLLGLGALGLRLRRRLGGASKRQAV